MTWKTKYNSIFDYLLGERCLGTIAKILKDYAQSNIMLLIFNNLKLATNNINIE